MRTLTLARCTARATDALNARVLDVVRCARTRMRRAPTSGAHKRMHAVNARAHQTTHLALTRLSCGPVCRKKLSRSAGYFRARPAVRAQAKRSKAQRLLRRFTAALRHARRH